MKKHRIVLSTILLTLMLLFSSCSFASKKITYTLTPEACQAVFGCTPYGFVSRKENEIFRGMDDFYKKADVQNGNLILTMSRERVEQWKALCLEGIEKVIQVKSIDVSINDDYSKITCGYTENSTTSDEFSIAYVNPISCCSSLQFLNDPHKENISVEYCIINAKTNEVKFSKVYPQDAPWTFEFDAFDFR